jgi:hypothetical protein
MGLTVSLLISLSPESPCFSPGLSPSLWLGRERKTKNIRRKERRGGRFGRLGKKKRRKSACTEERERQTGKERKRENIY